MAFSSLYCKFAGDMTYEALWKRLTPLYEAGEAKAIARCSHWDRYLGMMTAMTQVPVPTTCYCSNLIPNWRIHAIPSSSNQTN